MHHIGDFRDPHISKKLLRWAAHATAEAILKLVDADKPPLRLALGSQVLPRARALYADRIATWEAWKDVSDAAQGEPTKITLGS